MRKYSIIINPMGDAYVLVVDSWIDDNGVKTEELSRRHIDITLSEALMITQDFINQNCK